jgi:hypothetical protein
MPIELLLPPRAKDLGGGFMVRRLLPAFHRQAVGPFVFFDHFGPIIARPEDNHDVRPHPHIGLATVTYLFEGAMLHRDSLGSVQRIEPGAINWMTSGRGIVHSERRPPDLHAVTHTKKPHRASSIRRPPRFPRGRRLGSRSGSSSAMPSADARRSPRTLRRFISTSPRSRAPHSNFRIPRTPTNMPSTAWMDHCASMEPTFPPKRSPSSRRAKPRSWRRRAPAMS